MKKMSKRLLSILLAAVLVLTTMPFVSLTAYADAESDLQAALDSFENSYIKSLKEDGYSALKTNMADAYEKYVEAYEVRQEGTAEEMDAARKALETEVAKMKNFEEATANFDVKIGKSETQQPKASYTNEKGEDDSDYNSVLYADGDKELSWSTDANEVIGGGTYGITSAQFYRVFSVYYPNAVLLYNGENTPSLPVIVGVRNNSYSTTEIGFQNYYETTADVELKDDWVGTNDGRYNDSASHLYSTPTYPNPIVKDDNDVMMYVSKTMGIYPFPVTQDNKTYYATNNSSNYQVYRNSINYVPQNKPTTGLSKIDSISWLGSIAFSYSWLVTSVDGFRFIKKQESTKTKIRVINYGLLTDAIKDCLESNSKYFTVENARRGTLGTIFKALQRATAFDPNGYDYAGENYTEDNYRYDDDGNLMTALDAAAANCGDEIDEAVAELNAASNEDVADEYILLEAQMDSYVDKMKEKKVFTNMSEAYEIYCTAVEYADAYLYGGREEFEPRLGRLAYDLQVAVENMKPVGSSDSYTEYAGQAFEGDDDTTEKTGAYLESFKNLVYADSGPERNHTQSEKDTGNGRVLRIDDGGTSGLFGENPYGNAYLYIPYAVAVYDGTNFTDDNPARIPAMLGFISENAGSRLPSDKDRWLRYYTSTTDALQFEQNWKTRTYVAGDEDTYINTGSSEYKRYVFDVNTQVGQNNELYNGIKNGTITGMTKTYIETESLNEILNTNTIAEAKDAFSSSDTQISGLQSNMRSNHGYGSPDPENYYANTVRIALPTFSEDSTVSYENKEWTKYYHKYTTIAAKFGVATSSTGSINRTNSGSINTLGIYVINYKPILDIINANDDLLTGAPLDVTAFKEGGLEDYFSDMDKLTSCSPNNTKYNYYDKNAKVYDQLKEWGSTKTGYAAVTENCAYDIWKLLDSDSEDSIQVLDADGSYITDENIEEQKDTRISDTGDYKELKDQLAEKSDEEWAAVGTCQSGVYWNYYEAAVNAGKQIISYVATPIKDDDDSVIGHEGYGDKIIPYTFTYLDDDNNERSVTVNSVEAAAIEIDTAFKGLANAEKRTRHTVKFDHRRTDKTDRLGWDTGVFICNADNSHKWLYPEDWEEEHDEDFEDNTADMGVYDALQFAYTTIDFERYSNDLVIETGKAKFDTVINGGIGAPGETPQDMVDKGITELLTAITNANDIKYSVTYPIELSVVDADGATVLEKYNVNDIYTAGLLPANVFRFDKYDDEGNPTADAVAKEVLYGSTLTFTVPDDYKGKVYKWEIWTDNNRDGEYGDCNTKLVKDGTITGQATTSSFELAVQSPIKVKAFVRPEAESENDVVVAIQNQYGKPTYAFVADKATEITVDEASGTLTIGSRSFDISDELFKIPNYTITGFDIAITDEKKTLNDFAKDGAVEIPVKYELTNKNKTFTLKYNGKVIKEGIQYDEKVKVTSNAGDDFVAIVLKNNTGENQVFDYLPISYTKSFDYFAVCDMELYDLTSPEMTEDTFNLETFFITTPTGKEELDLKPIKDDDYDDMDYFRFAIERRKTKMPFVYTIMEKMSETDGKSKYAAHSYYTNIEQIEGGSDQAATFVEAGTVFTTDEAIAADRDKFKEGNTGVYTFKADKRLLDSYFYITASSKKTVYARSYVKYKYQFVNSRDDGSTDTTEIEAVIYGDIVNSADNDNGVYQG